MTNHLHFMGIAGVGMSGLARWYLREGHAVSGCDLAENAETAALRAAGIPVDIGHDPAHARGVDVLVSSMAVPADHPEILEARSNGARCIRRIDLLADLLELRRGLTITGTHGKSTTTGMLAHLLVETGRDPSVLVGGHLPALGGNFRYGEGDALVAEVDESDPGFALLRSHVAVVTNLEDDHIAGEYDERRNYHASLEDLEAAARSFAERAGTVLYCADWPGLQDLLGDLRGALTYGQHEGADYRLEGLELSAGGSRSVVRAPDGSSAELRLRVPGRHNAQNALAAVAVAHLEGVALEDGCRALASFDGVGRRWQRHGSIDRALVIDDYAHHPTEVGATLDAARHTGRRVRAVLQPHRWVRTARHWRALADAAAKADEILVLDIYAAGERAIPGVSAQLIVDRLRSSGKNAALHDAASAQAYLAGSLEPDDLVITLGAGDVWKVAAGLVQARGGDDGSA